MGRDIFRSRDSHRLHAPDPPRDEARRLKATYPKRHVDAFLYQIRQALGDGELDADVGEPGHEGRQPGDDVHAAEYRRRGDTNKPDGALARSPDASLCLLQVSQ